MPTEVKSSGVGIVLSFFWTGLGQLYAGRIARGLLMMLATPIIWMISIFGGGLGFLGGLAVLGGASQADSAAVSTGGGVGIVGVVLFLSAFAWWVWGMVDAKKLCDAFNAGGGQQAAASS